MSHVFLSHNSADKPQVIRLARALAERGIRVWLDVFELRPADWWGPKIQEAVETASVVLACIGEHGKGPWHDRELEVARRCERDVRVVCLPGWTPEHRRLGLDDKIADGLHEDWDGGIAILAEALRTRASADERPEAPGGPFEGSPYPGIDRGFGPEHAAWFFGREAETAAVVQALRQHRWVWLVGNSGSGKSSVARAGVMSWWPRVGDPSAGTGVATVFEPTEKATEDMAGALDRACQAAGKGAVDLQKLAADPTGWSVELRARFGGEQVRTPLLVVIDQVEQIFAERGFRGTCAAMLSALQALTTDDELAARVHVLGVLRADWLPRALKEDALAPLFRGSWTQFTLPGMDDAHVRDSIAIPARRAGGQIDRHAVEALVEAVRGREHGLPLLQLVLQDAWRRVLPVDRIVRLETIGTRPLEDAIGRLVSEQGSKPHAPLSDAQLDALVLALVELDDRDAPRRRWMPRSELEGRADGPALQQALDVLVRARVVVAQGAQGNGPAGSAGSGWQLAHEVVLKAWSAFADAIARRADLLKQVAALGRLATEGTLLRGASLRRYEALRGEPSLAEPVREFLDRSLEAERAELAAQARANAERRRLRMRLAVGLGGGLLAALILTGGLLWRGWTQERLQRKNADDAVRREQGARATMLAETGSGMEALLLGIDAVGGRGAKPAQASPEAVAGLVAGLMAARPVIELKGHSDWTSDAAFSPDGSRLVVRGNNEVLLWDVRGARVLATLRGAPKGVGKVEISPDGSYIVTYDTDDHVHLWNGRDGGLITPLSGHQSAVFAAAFSPDSLRLATGDGAGTLRIWDLGMDSPVLSIPAHDGPPPDNAISDVAFSRDGSLVATAGWDSTVRLWSVRDGKSVVEPLRGHEGWVNAVVFSPTDGELLVTAGNDGTVRIWSVRSGKELLRYKGLFGRIISLAFSPDGERLAAAGENGSGWIFSTKDAYLPDLVARRQIPAGSDHAAGRPVAALIGHSPSSPGEGSDITSIAFSPDGSQIATASSDKTVRLWHAYDGRQLAALRTPSYAQKVVFAPDGMRLAAVGDAFAWVWDARNGRPLVELDREGKGRSVHDIAYSSDGSQLMTTSEHWTSRVWDLRNGRVIFEPPTSPEIGRPSTSAADSPYVLTVHRNTGSAMVWKMRDGSPVATLDRPVRPVSAAAFSQDGAHLVTAEFDHIARVWDSVTGKHLFDLEQHKDFIHAVVFSPDGSRIVTGSDDKTARLWSIVGTPVATLEGAKATVRRVVFSPDSRRLLTAGYSSSDSDATAHLWNGSSGALVAELKKHVGPVTAARFSPDSSRLATGSNDGTVHIWDADTGELVLTLYGHAKRINAIAFSPDGRTLATGSEDKSARLWDVGSGKPLGTLPGYKADVAAVAFSPDGRHLAIGGGDDSMEGTPPSEDGSIRIYAATAEGFLIQACQFLRDLSEFEQVKETCASHVTGAALSRRAGPD